MASANYHMTEAFFDMKRQEARGAEERNSIKIYAKNFLDDAWLNKIDWNAKDAVKQVAHMSFHRGFENYGYKDKGKIGEKQFAQFSAADPKTLELATELVEFARSRSKGISSGRSGLAELKARRAAKAAKHQAANAKLAQEPPVEKSVGPSLQVADARGKREDSPMFVEPYPWEKQSLQREDSPAARNESAVEQASNESQSKL